VGEAGDPETGTRLRCASIHSFVPIAAGRVQAAGLRSAVELFRDCIHDYGRRRSVSALWQEIRGAAQVGEKDPSAAVSRGGEADWSIIWIGGAPEPMRSSAVRRGAVVGAGVRSERIQERVFAWS